MVDWSNLGEELLEMIAVRLFSDIELKRFRSICRNWRSSVSGSVELISSRPLIKLNPLVVFVLIQEGVGEIQGLDLRAFLSRASFFRVTLSSSPNKGWLIKSEQDVKPRRLHRIKSEQDVNLRRVHLIKSEQDVNLGRLHLIKPLSRLSVLHSYKSLDLLRFTVTEVQEGYLVDCSLTMKRVYAGFKKVILVTVAREDRVVGIGYDGKIRYWNGEIWTRIKDQLGEFSDIIVHKGLTYALDSKGIVWWINSSLSIFRCGPSLDEVITTDSCRDMSLVGCCGELYIVDRLPEKTNADDNVHRGNVNPSRCNVIHDDFGDTRCESPKSNNEKTVGFKVYKMDDEMGIWVQVKSMEDNAFVMATDTCFSVVAHEYYECLPNSIYFTDEMDKETKVFKLEDGSIQTVDAVERSCFLNFVSGQSFPSKFYGPSFL